MNPSDESLVVNLNNPGQTPTALVFTDSTARRMTPAEAKRARFIKGLKNNYSKLNEALAFFEHFAAICELSLECRDDVHKVNQAVIAELTDKFKKKLADYDKRNKDTA